MSEVTRELEGYLNVAIKAILAIFALRGLTIVLGDSHHMPIIDDIFFWLVGHVTNIIKASKYLIGAS